MNVDAITQQELRDAGQTAVGGQATDHIALRVNLEDRADFLAARFGDDGFVFQRLRIGQQLAGLALQECDFGVRENIFQDKKAVAVELIGLGAADGCAFAPLAMHDRIEARQKFRHIGVAGRVDVLHGTSPLLVVMT